MAEDQTIPAEHEAGPDAIEHMLRDGHIGPALEAANSLGADRAAWNRGLAVLEAREDVPAVAAWTAAMRVYFPDDAQLAAANAWTTTHTAGAETGLPLWQAARTRFPEEAEMRRGLAVALGLAGRREEQEAVLAGAVQDHPEQPALYLAWAECAVARGDLGAAIQRYDQGRRTFPELFPFYLGVADVLSRIGRHQDAYDLVQRTTEALSDASLTAPTVATIRERAAQAGFMLSNDLADAGPSAPPPSAPARTVPAATAPPVAEPDVSRPKDQPTPTNSPAWSLLRGETDVPEEARAAFVSERLPDPEPPKRRGLLGRLLGR